VAAIFVFEDAPFSGVVRGYRIWSISTPSCSIDVEQKPVSKL